MDDLIFKYYLFASFLVSIFKSFKKGARSEAISLLFIVLGLASALFFYKSNIKNATASCIVFFGVYIFGLIKAYKNEKHSLIQSFFGAILGCVKFLILLMTVTTISILLNSTPSAFENIKIIQIIMPITRKAALYLANK